MRIKPHGGIGDELMMTALVREYKRAFPDEELTLADCARRDIWKNCPYLNWGKTNNGKEMRPDTYSYPDASTPHGFAKQLGFELVDDSPEVWLDVKERALDFGISNWDKTLALDVEARWESRQWEPARFAAVVAALREDGWRVFEVGYRDDVSSYPVISTKIPADRSFVGKLKLRETMAFLGNVSLYLGNDSGNFHMAAAVNTPQVVLFGPIKWHQRAYWNTTSVFSYRPCATSCNVKCSRQSKPPYGKMEPCMDEIRPERVLDAVRVAYNRFVEPGLRITRPAPGRSSPAAFMGVSGPRW